MADEVPQVLIASMCSTFVNGRSRSELVKDLRERVDDDRGSYAEELAAAVQVSLLCYRHISCSSMSALLIGY